MPAKHRENQYFGDGVGRKTGTVLPVAETGEDGFERQDHIFSSPEKGPRGAPEDVTITSSEAMEIQQSSIPEPTETITVQKALKQSSKTVLPPPKGRSPIKTALGSSPRRQSSIGPASRWQQADKPNRAASHPAIRRRLFENDSLDEIDEVGLSAQNPAVDVYALQPSPVRALGRQLDPTMEEEASLAIDPAFEDFTTNGFAADYDDNELHVTAEDQLMDDDFAASDLEEAPVETPVPGKRVGRKRKSDVAAEEQAEEESRPAKVAKSATKRGARKPLVAAQHPSRPVRQTRRSLNSSTIQDDSNVADDSIPAIVPVKLKTKPQVKTLIEKAPKGKGKGKGKENAVAEASVLEEPIRAESSKAAAAAPGAKKRGRPAKRDLSVLEDAPEEAAEVPIMPPPKRKPSRKPKEKDANAPIAKAVTKSAKPAKPIKSAKVERDIPAATLERTRVRSASVAPSNFSMMSTRSRSNVTFREMTPGLSGVEKSRKGRVLRAPLQWWLGEKDEFDNNRELKSWTEAEIVEPEKRLINRRKTPRKKPALQEIAEEEMEPWEIEEQILPGIVNSWNDEENQLSGEQIEEDIAFAESAIQTRPVENTSFEYNKICGVHYFNVGLLKIPPEGEKKRKNSRRMHMVFYVLQGPVEVTVGDDLQFTINAGGAWQVPRGNLYSIRNVSNNDAKMLFAQAHNQPEEVE